MNAVDPGNRPPVGAAGAPARAAAAPVAGRRTGAVQGGNRPDRVSSGRRRQCAVRGAGRVDQAVSRGPQRRRGRGQRDDPRPQLWRGGGAARDAYPVSAESITPARLLRIDAARLRHLLQTDPMMATSMLAATYVHLQQLVEQVEHLKARSGVQRVAEFLLDLATCAGQLFGHPALQQGADRRAPGDETRKPVPRLCPAARPRGQDRIGHGPYRRSRRALRELAAEDPAKAWMR